MCKHLRTKYKHQSVFLKLCKAKELLNGLNILHIGSLEVLYFKENSAFSTY